MRGTRLAVVLTALVVSPSLATAQEPDERTDAKPQAWEDRAGDELRGQLRKLRKLEKRKAPNPEKLITALQQVGRGYRDIGGYLAAQHYLGKALAMAEESEAEPLVMAGVLDMLGSAYFYGDDPARALELWERSLHSAEQAFGSMHVVRGIGLCKKGAALGALGRVREGEAAILEGVEIIYQTAGPASRPEVQACETMAELLLAQGRLSSAHELLVYALSVRSGGVVSSAAMQMPPKELLGVLFAMAGIWEEAEPFLEDVLEVYDSEGMNQHPDLEQVHLVMAAVQEGMGRAEAAGTHREHAAEIHAANAGFSHPDDRPLEPRWNLRQGAEGAPGPMARAQVGDWVAHVYGEDGVQERIEVTRMTTTAVVLRTSHRPSSEDSWEETGTGAVGLTETVADIYGLRDARVESGTFRWGSIEMEGQVATLEPGDTDGGAEPTVFYFAPGVIPLWGTVRVEEGSDPLMELLEYQFAGKEKRALEETLPESAAPAVAASLTPLEEQATRWTTFVEEELEKGDTAARQIEEYRREHGIPLPFWPGRDLKETTDHIAFSDEHPCGGSAVAVLKEMPGDGQPLDIDPVYEIDQAGQVLRKWRTPIDANVEGVSGEELIVWLWLPTGACLDWERGGRTSTRLCLVDAFDAGINLAIHTDGRFRVIAPLGEPYGVDHSACPEGMTVLKGSSYAGCQEFTDRADDTQRIIASQGPCT